ncbi:MAG: hypothetical protein KC505_11485 [Myxococcales bacterium]|nr:hypothetical protein [Myxococcales bacterium]USN50133.1 MAG: hypothetical protein H6731_07635 [Myxococcales bacterium]
MSMKNQSRLSIFALMIIGATVLSLFGLNYLVEAIAEKKTPVAAHRPPFPQGNKFNGRDDSLNEDDSSTQDSIPSNNFGRMNLGKRPYPNYNKKMPPGFPPNMNQPPMHGMPNHVQRGNHSANIQRSSPPSHPVQEPNNHYGTAPNHFQPNNAGQPPFPTNNNNFRPSEEDIRRMEMERRRMMESFPPPPGYYNPDDRYDDSYDGPPDDYYDDYAPDYEGKIEKKNKDEVKLSQASDEDEIIDTISDELDMFIEDDYLYDILEDED